VIPLYLIDDYAPFPLNAMSATYAPWVNYAPWLWRLAYRFGSSRASSGPNSPPLLSFAGDHPAPRYYVARSCHQRPPLQINLPLRILRSVGNRAPFISVVTDP
jgi:hypothetical protein